VVKLTINKRVLQKVSPIALGYFVLGLACGMLGQKAHLNPLEMTAMSLLAYAGSSQFIGIAMMLQGASFFSIGLTVLMVNLRCALFSSTLAPFFSSWKKRALSAFAHGITDETFAVNLQSFNKENNPPWTTSEAITLNIIGCLVWSISNGIGCFAAEYLVLNISLVSYILTAMFLGIWSNYLVNRTMIITGITAGILSILLSMVVPYKLHIVLASLFCSALASYLVLKHEKGGAPHE
jgi:4-azaleucine resistance transporter AzlC